MKINTNLSSLMVQSNLTKSTNALNQAIERMTTGCKINHASDNAANYSISANYSSKISSCQIALDNISSGLDMISTAQETISLMESHTQRIMNLWTQAQNGTYDSISLETIQSEVDARVAEINRIYSNAEYNGISLFENFQLPDWAQEIMQEAGLRSEINPDYNGFISDPTTHAQSEVEALTHVSEVSSFISGNEYQISTKADLKRLAELSNSGVSTSGVTFVMGADIDLEREEWTPIDNFRGIFDGNGHKIFGLYISNSGEDRQGLFSHVAVANIKNLGLENVDVTGKNFVGGLVGFTDGNLRNCYVTGKVSGTGNTVGGLVGLSTVEIVASWSSANVSGIVSVGGLVGLGGDILDCYAAGDVYGKDSVGGIVGSGFDIRNSYATGNVYGTGSFIGGLGGAIQGDIMSSYATGNVSGVDYVGGIAGNMNNVTEIYNSYATGKITGTGEHVGALLWDTSNLSSHDAFATGTVNGVASSTDGFSVVKTDSELVLQVGIYGEDSSSIAFDSNLSLSLDVSDITSSSAYNSIQTFLNALNEKATQLGAISNRLESALDSTTTQMNNFVSSLSTIRDADVAKESSAYIKAQILQQAAATLLATANQSPSIALQLI